MDVNAKENENALIEAAKNGDASATETLLLRYKALVCKIARAYYLPSGGDAEDLIQEGTVGLLKAIREFHPEKSVPFIGFAATCIGNKVRDALRSLSADKHQPLNNALSISAGNGEDGTYYVDIPDANDNSPLAKYLDDEAREEFYKKIETLATPLQVSVLRLYLDGASYREIAETLKITTKKVDNAINAVKNKIRKAKALFS